MRRDPDDSDALFVEDDVTPPDPEYVCDDCGHVQEVLETCEACGSYNLTEVSI